MTFAEWFSTTPRGHNPTLTEAFAAGAASRDAEIATLRELKQAWHDKFWESEKEHNQLREQVKMLRDAIEFVNNRIGFSSTETYRQWEDIVEKALAATEPKP